MIYMRLLYFPALLPFVFLKHFNITFGFHTMLLIKIERNFKSLDFFKKYRTGQGCGG